MLARLAVTVLALGILLAPLRAQTPEVSPAPAAPPAPAPVAPAPPVTEPAPMAPAAGTAAPVLAPTPAPAPAPVASPTTTSDPAAPASTGAAPVPVIVPPSAAPSITPSGTPATPQSVPAATTPTQPTEIAPKVGPTGEIGYNGIHVDGPYIALTFDDGPHPRLTPKLLDILAAKKIKATFFMVGQNAAEYPAIVKRIQAEGHEVANHSWSHPSFAKLSDDDVRSQISRTQDAIFAACGVKPILMRPPYGAIKEAQRHWIPSEFNVRLVFWSIDPLDWKDPGASVVAERILSHAHQGSVVLSHDIHAGTVEAMPAVIDALQAKGYQFLTVSELIKKETAAPPKAPVDPAKMLPSATKANGPKTKPAAVTGTETNAAVAPAKEKKKKSKSKEAATSDVRKATAVDASAADSNAAKTKP